MPLASSCKIQSITLRHQIASRMRQAILEGSLVPGERLVERALAAQLGSSLTAVREALIQLETEGLITKRSNSTTHVTSLSRDEISKTFAIRGELERFAVTEAARRATPPDISRLEDLHLGVIHAARAKDPRVYIQRDLAWHEAVWAVSGNEVLVGALRRLIVPLFGFSSIRVVSRQSFDLLEDARLHFDILQAIARNNPDSAAKALRQVLAEWASQVLDEADG
ncbi:MAG: GntR family transcriptional regulator [Bryobacteraceae bacterium]